MLTTAADFKFIAHVAEHNLSYATMSEFEARKTIFAHKDAIFEEINSDPANTFTVGHNKFSTWTDSELDRIRGYKAVQRDVEQYEDGTPTASSVNWVTAGGVTPVKDQGNCGSCWAFSSTGALEGGHFAKKGELISLSEQLLVDCDHAGSDGCNGGDMQMAFYWAVNNKLEKESDYKYKAKAGTCHKADYTGLYNTAGANAIK